jgi:lantibiotic modifying enzyme
MNKDQTIKGIVLDYIQHINKDVFCLIDFYKEKNNTLELERIDTIINKLSDNINLYLSNSFDFHHIQKVKRLGDIHVEKICTLLIETINEKFIFKTFHANFIELLNHVFHILNQSEKFNYYLLYHKTEGRNVFIEYIDNELPKDINKFSFHYGGLILLLTLLRGTDFHADNILCKGSTPVIVDFETIFYPIISIFKKYDVDATSLIRTQHNKHTLMHKFNLNVEYIKQGICACYDIIKNHKKPIKNLIDTYCESPARVIFRPTNFYLELLKKITHPILITHKENKIKYLKNCLNEDKSIISFIIDDEIEDLLQLSIPFFYFHKGGLYSSRKERIQQDKISCSIKNIYESMDNINLIKNEIIDRL